MNNILLKAEAIYLHPNGELYEYAENDFLNILPETVYAAESFAIKKDYEKAAQAFIYVGYIWGETGNKESAMTAFKNAEKYGMLSGDSITTARAEPEHHPKTTYYIDNQFPITININNYNRFVVASEKDHKRR